MSLDTTPAGRHRRHQAQAARPAAALALALLQRRVDPDAVLRAQKTVIARCIARNASGNHPQERAIRRCARGWPSPSRPRRTRHPAQPIRRSPVDFTELQAEIAVEIDVVPAPMKALVELERRISALYTELQPDDVRRTIPGVGQHLAPVLLPPVFLGVLHTAGRFHAERHSRGCCGRFPRRADSGGAEQPGQTITPRMAPPRTAPPRTAPRTATIASSAPSCSPPLSPARSIPTWPRSTGG